MHEIAEYGVAAHWRYKEGAKSDAKLEAKIAWLRQLIEWQSEVKDAEEFVETLKSDVFKEMIYVFTPKGDIIELPAGATPLDFAYRIHTEVGHHMRRRQESTTSRSGSTPSCRTARWSRSSPARRKVGPSRDWLREELGYITTASAREKIRQWFRRQERDENIAQGKEILERELRRLGLDLRPEEIHKHFPRYAKVEDMLAAIGYGAISAQQIASRTRRRRREGSALRLAACCPSRRRRSGSTSWACGDLLTQPRLLLQAGQRRRDRRLRDAWAWDHRPSRRLPEHPQSQRSRAIDQGHLGHEGRRNLPGRDPGQGMGPRRSAQGCQHRAGR